MTRGPEIAGSIMPNNPDPALSRDEMVAKWTSLAHAGCRRFRNSGIAPDDLLQEAMLGLVVAVDAYDEAKGGFLSYGATVINNRLSKLCGEQMRAVRVPLYINNVAIRINRARFTLRAAGVYDPSVEQLAATAKVSVQRAHWAIDSTWVRLDDDPDGPEVVLADVLPGLVGVELALHELGHAVGDPRRDALRPVVDLVVGVGDDGLRGLRPVLRHEG